MRITRATPFVLGAPWRNLLFLKLEADAGIAGWSEARPLNRIDTTLGYLRETFERHVKGSDPFREGWQQRDGGK